MEYDIFFWWSVVSTLLSLIFLFTSLWQYFESKKQQAQHKSQVKIWMQDANGVHWGLQRIVQDNLDKRYSTTNDMANAVWTLDSSAFSLYQSLYEERCITETDYVQEQKEMREQAKSQSKANLPVESKSK